MTDRTDPTDQENPMSKTDRHDELVALLSKISEESVTTSNVLDDMLDLLRERLPEPEGVKDETTRCSSVRPGHADFVCTMPSGHAGKHGYAGVFWSQPAPADDLPGEPVEPGDLRAGERAPREDEDPDEALAMDLYHASLKIPSASKIGPTRWSNYTRDLWLDVARAARKHVEAERESRERTIVDEWDDMLARAEKAEAERDEWKARHEALREDVETRWAFVDDNFLKDILHSILKGDDERAKGADQR